MNPSLRDEIEAVDARPGEPPPRLRLAMRDGSTVEGVVSNPGHFSARFTPTGGLVLEGALRILAIIRGEEANPSKTWRIAADNCREHGLYLKPHLFDVFPVFTDEKNTGPAVRLSLHDVVRLERVS